jgi:hypothetical protein
MEVTRRPGDLPLEISVRGIPKIQRENSRERSQKRLVGEKEDPIDAKEMVSFA